MEHATPNNQTWPSTSAPHGRQPGSHAEMYALLAGRGDVDRQGGAGTRLGAIGARHAGLIHAAAVGAAAAAAAAMPLGRAARGAAPPLLVGSVSAAVAGLSARAAGRAWLHRECVPAQTAYSFAERTSRAQEEQRRFLHGNVLQTLEALCAPDSANRWEILRRQAFRDVGRLRGYLGGHDAGSAADVEEMVDQLIDEGDTQGLEIHVVREDGGDPPPALSREALSALHLAASEALANVVKHAGVSAATLRLSRDSGGLLVSVADAGRGFDPAGPIRADSYGLRHTIGATTQVGGSAVVDAMPAGGTIVRLWVPQQHRAARSDGPVT